MKKILMCMAIIITLLVPSLTYADTGSFELNGKHVNKDIKIVFDNNRMMFLSLNTIAKELNYKVKVDNDTKSVSIFNEKEKFTFYLEGAEQKDENIPILKGSKIVGDDVLMSAPIVSHLFNGNAQIDNGKLKITAKGPINPIKNINPIKKLTAEEKEKLLVRGTATITSMRAEIFYSGVDNVYLEAKSGNKNLRFYLLGIKKKTTTTQKQLDKFMVDYIGKELSFVIDRSIPGKTVEMLTSSKAGYIYSGDKMLNIELIKSGLYELDEREEDIVYLDEMREALKPIKQVNAESVNQEGIKKPTVIKNR